MNFSFFFLLGGATGINAAASAVFDFLALAITSGSRNGNDVGVEAGVAAMDADFELLGDGSRVVVAVPGIVSLEAEF